MISDSVSSPPPPAAPTSDQLFRPDTEVWTPISPDFARVEPIAAVLGWGPFALAAIIPCLIWTPWWVAALVTTGVLAFVGWRVWSVRRLARTWAYAQRESDLLITHGRLFKQLTVVPYGRMQVVEVNSGPLLRAYGLASVQLKTASSDTGATIPGVRADEAARLREELSRLGEAQAAGL